MKTILLTILLTAAGFYTASAKVTFEIPSAGDTFKIAMDTLGWNKILTSYDALLTISDFTTAETGIWLQGEPRPDTSTHYINGLDTVITRHRIECDTVIVEKTIVNDIPVIRLKVECDTIFRVEYLPVWKPKIGVLLEPDQLRRLLWLIEHSDEILMSETYGQKEK